MRLVIESREFAALSRETQLELLGRFGGESWRRGVGSGRSSERDDRLIDLTPMQAAQLVESLCEDLRRFLQVFAQRGGRVRLDELLPSAKHSDSDDASRSTQAIEDSLRKLLGGNFAGKSLFVCEGNDAEETVYRVSGPTTRSLRCFFPVL